MAKTLYGITNSQNRWMFYTDGRLMAFDDVRIAYANLMKLEGEMGGAPFLVQEIGNNGDPVALSVDEPTGGFVTAGRKK